MSKIPDIKIGGISFEIPTEGVIIDRTSPEVEYAEDYTKKLLKFEMTSLGVQLCKLRKTYAEIFSKDTQCKILGFGCGRAPCVRMDIMLGGSRWYAHDVNTDIADMFEDRFLMKPDLDEFGTVCLFDCLEHMRRPEALLQRLSAGTRLIVSIPLYPETVPLFSGIEDWRHWREGEHFMNATVSGFLQFAQDNGLVVLDQNQIEASLGRLDIFTFCFEKV